MEKESLMFAGLVLMVCLAGFVVADVDNNSVENSSVGDDNVYVVAADEVLEEIDDLELLIGEEMDEGILDSYFDKVGSWYEALLEKVDDLTDGNGDPLFLVIVVVIVIVLILFFVFSGGLPGMMYFRRAAVFHKRAEKAHLKGKYEKARKLYRKSYLLREKGREDEE